MATAVEVDAYKLLEAVEQLIQYHLSEHREDLHSGGFVTMEERNEAINLFVESFKEVNVGVNN